MVTEIILVMTDFMKKVEEIFDKDHIIETKEGIILLEGDPEATVVQDGYTEYKTTIEIEVTIDNKVLEVNPDNQLEVPDLHHGL